MCRNCPLSFCSFVYRKKIKKSWNLGLIVGVAWGPSLRGLDLNVSSTALTGKVRQCYLTVYATRERLERLQLLETEFTLKKRLREDSDASHEGQGYVPVDLCGGGSPPLSLATQPFQRPQHKRPLWDKSIL